MTGVRGAGSGGCFGELEVDGEAVSGQMADVEKVAEVVPGAGAGYVYDQAGRLATVVGDAGEVARYGYDATGNITFIKREAAPANGVIDVNPRGAAPARSVVDQSFFAVAVVGFR